MRKKIIAFAAALTICAGMNTALYGTEVLNRQNPMIAAAEIKKSAISGDYANASLFDDTKVHTVNLIITDDEWQKIADATSDNREYANCDVEIDGEVFKNVAVKAKGHASFSFARGRKDKTNERVGLRIKFDKNDENTTYHGLNKLSLNNLAADTTCMKDFIAYHMMNDMGVHSPLSSYTVVQRNGEDFALFLAVEDVDKSFAVRNYGDAEVDLYQPESEAAATQSDLQAALQVFSGNAYADLDKTDRVEPWCEISAKMHPEELKDAACCRWIDDNADSYQNIWDSDELKCTDEDKAVMIDSLNKLNNGTPEEALSVLDTDQLMRYWAVHSFMNNYDSIVSKARAWNFYICENNGVLSYIPWDYNESFGGMDARVVIRDVFGNLDLDTTTTGLDNVMSAEKDLINMPIDNPNRVGGTEQLPMLHKWISNEECKEQYHEICTEMTGLEKRYTELTARTKDMLEPYVQKSLTFYTDEQFSAAMKHMDLYMKYRFESVRGQASGEIPSTWEGQKEKPETLIEPEGLELYKMASATNIIGCPPASVINPVVNAFLGKDPDRSIEHFSKLILDYFKNPLTMFDKVPIMVQVSSCRSEAVKTMHQKYGTAGLFTVQGGPPAASNGGEKIPENQKAPEESAAVSEAETSEPVKAE